MSSLTSRRLAITIALLLTHSGLPTSTAYFFVHIKRNYNTASNDYVYERNGYDEETEEKELYRPGGFHPMHLGDALSSHYRIMHKLGFGGFATVWLARDESLARNVAIKILTAEASTNCSELEMLRHLRKLGSKVPKTIEALLDDFEIEGPNGRHVCLVTEVLGPGVAQQLREYGSFGVSLAQHIASCVVEAVTFLHDNGIVHGDLSTTNVLNKLTTVTTLPEEELMTLLSEPATTDMVMTDWSDLSPSAPKYLVHPTDLGFPDWLERDVVLIDFGEAFFIDKDPPRQASEIGYTLGFGAPEVILQQALSPASDIWALGCVIYEIRAGDPLIDPLLGSKNSTLMESVQYGGKFPDELWNSWADRGKWFDVEGALKKDQRMLSEWTLGRSIENIGMEREQPGQEAQKLSVEEKACFEELLRMMLQSDPLRRRPVKEIAIHPWFKGKFEEDTKVEEEGVEEVLASDEEGAMAHEDMKEMSVLQELRIQE